jgi:hypothetical protein
MSLWSFILDVLLKAWSAILDIFIAVPTFGGAIITYLFQTVPTLGGAVIAFLGVVLAQHLTHRYTQRREHEKLLREKAEDLIHTLCQLQHSLFVWHDGLMRDMHLSLSRLEYPQERTVGSISLESLAVSVYPPAVPKLPEPADYRALAHAAHRDLQQADTLQRLYFPSVRRSYEAYTDLLAVAARWLETHMMLQEEKGISSWVTQMTEKDFEEWSKLDEAYGTSHAELIEAVARAILPYRRPSRVLWRLRRQGQTSPLDTPQSPHKTRPTPQGTASVPSAPSEPQQRRHA